MKKNIWIWNHYATDMYYNRGGRHYWFAKELIKRGYNTTIFCANTYHNKNDYIDTKSEKYSEEIVDSIPFVFVRTTTSLNNGIDRIKNMYLFYKNLFNVSKRYAQENVKPDVILASSVHPLTMVAGIRVAKKFGIPCICEVRDLWPEAIFFFGKLRENSLLGKILIKGEYWIYKNADSIIFTKEGDIDYIKERKWDLEQGGKIDLKKCHYINNGIDLEQFNQSINENILTDEDLEDDTFKVIYTGSIRPINNIMNLVETAKLLAKHNDIKILIYGEGNQRKELEKEVLKMNLQNIIFKGSIEKKYIPYILSKSSVNILNYSQDQYNWSRGNSSNKLFEYMASKKPIISTVKMGYCILERYLAGISLEESTSENLYEAIIKIKLLNKEKYTELGDNAYSGVKNFDFKILSENLINIITTIGES